MFRQLRQLSQSRFSILFAIFLSGCVRELSECNGPAMDFSAINVERNSLFSEGVGAALVLPNPIDATERANARATDSDVRGATELIQLPNLSLPSKLENSVFKVLLHSLNDSDSILAKPSQNGNYEYPITDLHYAEAMGYHSVVSVLRYINALGFNFDINRKLVILAHALDDGASPAEANAFYEHGTLDQSLPHIMRMYGDGEFAPGADADMYTHETGHHINEKLSGEVGIDAAGERGAIFSEGAALHECLADYLAESMGNKPHLGAWINRNFEGTKAGEPLRSAVDRPGDVASFEKVMAFGGDVPERYAVAEVCSRALWRLRSQFVAEDPKNGAYIADRVVFSSLGLLGRDASMRGLHSALQEVDQKLHCGLHTRTIGKAFEERGLQTAPVPLDEGDLDLAVAPVGLVLGDEGFNGGPIQAGKEVGFKIRVRNQGSETARNVRIVLESASRSYEVSVYMQAFGDLAAGKSILIGDGGLDYLYSPFGLLNSSVPRGTRIRFRIKVLIENGPETVSEGEFGL